MSVGKKLSEISHGDLNGALMILGKLLGKDFGRAIQRVNKDPRFAEDVASIMRREEGPILTFNLLDLFGCPFEFYEIEGCWKRLSNQERNFLVVFIHHTLQKQDGRFHIRFLGSINLRYGHELASLIRMLVDLPAGRSLDSFFKFMAAEALLLSLCVFHASETLFLGDGMKSPRLMEWIEENSSEKENQGSTHDILIALFGRTVWETFWHKTALSRDRFGSEFVYRMLWLSMFMRSKKIKAL